MRKLTAENWIEKAKEIHGEKFNYDLTVYSTAKKKLIIICSIHGEQNMLPHHHINGYGCGKCGREMINVSNGKQLTQEKFIDRIKNIEGLSFEKTVYKNKRTKVIVTCIKHGDYETTAEVLLKGGWLQKMCLSRKKSQDNRRVYWGGKNDTQRPL